MSSPKSALDSSGIIDQSEVGRDVLCNQENNFHAALTSLDGLGARVRVPLKEHMTSLWHASFCFLLADFQSHSCHWLRTRHAEGNRLSLCFTFHYITNTSVNMSEGWSLTESDPAIVSVHVGIRAVSSECAPAYVVHTAPVPSIAIQFTALLSELGVKGLEVSELYSLDASLLSSLQPIYALIFLFKYVDPAESPASSDPSATGTPKEDTDFYFAHQVINNACATMAILNVGWMCALPACIDIVLIAL